MVTKRKSKLLIIALSVVLLLLVILPQLGYWLIDTGKPEKADAIFLLMGDTTDRVTLAIDLYKAGYAPAIVMVKPVVEIKGPIVQDQATLQPLTEAVCESLYRHEIDSSAITVLPGPAGSTMDEARAIAGWCKQHTGIRKVLIATSTYHTARAGKIFRKVFEKTGLNVEVILPFNHHSLFQPKGWYLRKPDTGYTLSESSKMLYYWCWTRWKIQI